MPTILVFVFLIWICGGSEHVSGDLMIAPKTSAAFGAQGIRIRELSNRADYERRLLNGSQLSSGEIEPRHDCHRNALAVTNSSWSEWLYIWIDTWGFPEPAVPKGHLGGDPSDCSLCITDIEHREIHFKHIIYDGRLKNKLPNDQFWPVSGDKFVTSQLI